MGFPGSAAVPSSSAGASTETDAQKLARLESENSELRAAESSEAAEPGTESAPQVAPLQALAASVAESPDKTFIEHLEQLADDGITAVISPSVAEKVTGVLAAIVADLVKVKL